jgi:hypothetical protein
MADPVGEKTTTRPLVAPTGTVTVIVVAVRAVGVVDIVPNCTRFTVAKPVPVIVIDVPTEAVVRLSPNLSILGAADASPDDCDTGARTCMQLATPIPVAVEGTVPAGHVIVCSTT